MLGPFLTLATCRRGTSLSFSLWLDSEASLSRKTVKENNWFHLFSVGDPTVTSVCCPLLVGSHYCFLSIISVLSCPEPKAEIKVEPKPFARSSPGQ